MTKSELYKSQLDNMLMQLRKDIFAELEKEEEYTTHVGDRVKEIHFETPLSIYEHVDDNLVVGELKSVYIKNSNPTLIFGINYTGKEDIYKYEVLSENLLDLAVKDYIDVLRKIEDLR